MQCYATTSTEYIAIRQKALKMLYLIGPNGLVNRGFINFQKMVWMTVVHVFCHNVV